MKFQFDREKGGPPLKGFGSLDVPEEVAREKQATPDVTYSWSGITVRTRQQRRSLKDAMLQREAQKPKTILQNGGCIG